MPAPKQPQQPSEAAASNVLEKNDESPSHGQKNNGKRNRTKNPPPQQPAAATAAATPVGKGEDETVRGASESPSLPPPLREDALGLFAFASSGGSGGGGGESGGGSGGGDRSGGGGGWESSKLKACSSEPKLKASTEEAAPPRKKKKKKKKKKQEQAQPRKRARKSAAATTKKEEGGENAEEAKSLATPIDAASAEERGSLVAEGPGFRLLRLRASFVLHSKQPEELQQEGKQQVENQERQQKQQGGGGDEKVSVAVHGRAAVAVSRGASSLVVCLPAPVDASGVTATMSRGVVRVSMPFLAGGVSET